MNERIEIWLVGNTGLRNPKRIQEGFAAYANSPFIGRLHGRENELGFMRFLDEQGIISNEDGKDVSGSHARKWRFVSMFEADKVGPEHVRDLLLKCEEKRDDLEAPEWKQYIERVVENIVVV